MKIVRPSKRTLLTIVVTVVCTIIVATLIATLFERHLDVRLPSFGTIRTMGYEAYEGDIIVQDGKPTIEWGRMLVGESANRSFYLRSISNVPTIARMNVTDWEFKNEQGNATPPPPINSIEVNWNLNDTVINPNQEVYATFMVGIQADPAFIHYLVEKKVTQFNFVINIYGSDV